MHYKYIQIPHAFKIHMYVFAKKIFQNNGLVWFNPLKCFFGSEGHVALDRNPGTGYDTLLLRMIPGDLFSAFPHRQFHTLPGLLDSWAALPNSNPNACMPMQGGSLYHFYDGLWYDPAERRTHDLPCERRTRYRLSQPDTVQNNEMVRCKISKLIFIYIIKVNSYNVRMIKCKVFQWFYIIV